MLHHGEKNIGIALWCDTVAEVEDVSSVSAVRGEDFIGRGNGMIASREYRRRVEVSLENDVGPDSSTHLVQRNGVVDTEYSGARVVHGLEQM